MEVELKYYLDNEKIKDEIFNDEKITSLFISPKEEVPMKATYFDTDDFDISKRGLAFRLREEGEKYIATFKWQSKDGEGKSELSKRGEINVEVFSEFKKNPRAEVFIPYGNDEAELVACNELIEAIGFKELKPIITTDVIRTLAEIKSEDFSCEISVDLGELRAGNESERICELELEYDSGNLDKMLALGESLKEKYNLKPGTFSKYKRGLILLRML